MLTLNVTIDNAIAMMFIILVLVLFIVQMFRLRLRKCLRYLKMAKALIRNRTMIGRFQSAYVSLYREVAMYNDSFRECWLSMDVMIKLSCTQFVILYSKQDHLGVFFYVVIFLFASTILYFEFVFATFSSLHNQNQSIYRHLNAWNSQHFHQSIPVEPKSIKPSIGHRKLLSVHGSVKKLLKTQGSLRFSLKTNLFLQSVSDNQLGFTCGRLYHFTKFRFIENMLINLGFLALFYKKIIV